MRWAVTGSGGQLGQCLVQGLAADPGEELVGAFSHSDLDIADNDAIDAVFAAVPGGPPDVLVNAAAFTAVDLCESEEPRARRTNGDGPGRLAERCHSSGTRLVHVSTDYVFDGTASEPYPEDARPQPRTAYGRSKAEGERQVLNAAPEALVVRTSWVFGPGHNFVAAILRQVRLRRSGEVAGPLRVVDDQLGCPTYALDLAGGIRALAGLSCSAGSSEKSEMQGIFHLSGAGVVSWCGFARAILDLTGNSDLEILPLSTDQLDLPAERPRYSVLNCGRAAALGVTLRPWQEGLAAYLGSPAGALLMEGA